MSLEGLVRVAFSVGRLLAVGAVAGGLLFVGGMTQIGLNDYLRPPRAVSAVTPADLGLAYRDALLLTDDGLMLASWFVPGTRSDTLILVHGLGSERSGLLPIARDLHAVGFNVLLLDLRAHGQSEGNLSTLGVKETLDIRAAMGYLRNQPEVDPERIGIYGGSLGGSVALLSAATMPELRAIAVDSTFASARWVVDHQLQSLLSLPEWFGPLLLGLGSLEAGISPDDAAPATAAAHLGQRPLLVIHGTSDTTFDVANAHMLYAAASGPRELWILDGVGHTGAYDHNPGAFIERLDGFFSYAL